MSVVIVGGHDRMVRQYIKICQDHKCKAKVFTQMCTGLDKKIGCPDLVILFTSTVSHKMVRCVLDEVDSERTDIRAIWKAEGDFPMRSACCWNTPWRMYGASLKKRGGISSVQAIGRCTAI